MSLLSDIRERVAALLFRRRAEREMDEEIRFHLDREAEERVRRGDDPAVARRDAARAFGGVERYKEEIRDARGVTLIEQVVADCRYALRALARNPGFTAAAVIVLGLAIGAATTVFRVADAVLFSDLPYRDAGRLVRIYHRNNSTFWWGLSVADVMAIRDQQRSLSSFGAMGFASGTLSGIRNPEAILMGRVTSGFFDALDVRPAAGRLITPGDEIPGAPPVVVLTDALATRAYGGALAAVGRTATIDGVSHTIVGVLPPGMNRLANLPAPAWTPMVLQPPTRRGPFGIRGFGRLRDGVSLEAAAADLAGISARIFPIWKAGFTDSTARYAPVFLRDSIVGPATRQIGLFAAAVLLVLLVAIANVATLLVVRASSREQELAVRAALGAGRRRLGRLVAAEGAMLTLLAGAVGFAAAWLGVRFLATAAPTLPRAGEVTFGWRGAAFVGLLALVSGTLVNLPPVASALAGRRRESLRLDARRSGTSRGTNAFRGTLVVAEFALALPLLLGAGLLLNSFLRLQRVDPGFDPVGAISVRVTLPRARYPDSIAVLRFWERSLARLTELPDLTGVGLVADLPPDTQGQTNNFNLVGRPAPDGSDYVSPWTVADAGYFRTLGIPLAEGRMFSEMDSTDAPPVVLVSQAWARKYFPGESAVGKQLVSGGCTTCPATTVIGVVGDVKYGGMAGDGDGVYTPVEQGYPRTMHFVARAPVTPAAAFAEIRREIAAVDPELAPVEFTLADQVHASLGDPRRWTGLLSAFASAALALAALGIFGLMSYTVRQRRREIGVRLALGAEPATITGMIVRRGMLHAAAGTIAGLLLALLESRWVGSMLYGVSPLDPVTLAGAALLLLLVALGATWLPGLRAARVKPVEVMQTD